MRTLEDCISGVQTDYHSCPAQIKECHSRYQHLRRFCTRAIHLARRTMGIVWQNIVFALGVKFAVLVLAAFGIANMWMAVFADVGVAVIAILNAMRAMNVKRYLN